MYVKKTTKIMKTIIVLLMCVFMFLACNKKDDVIINNPNIGLFQSELAGFLDPNKQEFVDLVSSRPALKSAGGVHLIEVFPLAQETFQILDKYVVKNYVYYDLNSDSKRIELLTPMQRFEIVNEKIVTTSYRLDYKFGCEFSREFSIDAGDAEIWEIVCIFHLKDGRQFAYFFDGNPYSIKLPNIANGNWEITVKTYDGDLERNLTTGFIDFGNATDELSLLTQAKATNVAAKFGVNRDMMKGVSSVKFVGENPETGQEIWIYIPFRYSENLPGTLLFDVPFSPKSVVLIYEDNSFEEFWIQDNWTQKSGQLPNYFINN